MSEALAPSSNIEWLENYYQQQTLDDWEVPFGGISDSNISDSKSFRGDLFPGSDTMLTSSVPHDGTRTPDGIPGFTTENSSAANYDLSPKTTVAKQVRRRSRASRRKPTTLLNASIKNFRTLVQQYTGCQSATAAFRSGKGPITLSFGSSSSNQNDFPAPSSLATAFDRGGNYYADLQAQLQEKQQHYNQQYLDQMLHQGNQSSLSLDENSSEFSALNHSGSPMLTVENCGWQ